MPELFPLSKNLFAIVDLESLPLLSGYSWSAQRSGKYAYAVSSDGVRMHRLIANAPEGMVVDHINHNTLDNRICNLRVCTHGENALNKFSKFLDPIPEQELSDDQGADCVMPTKDEWIALRSRLQRCLQERPRSLSLVEVSKESGIKRESLSAFVSSGSLGIWHLADLEAALRRLKVKI